MLGLRVGFGLRLGLRFRLIVTISVSLGSLLVVTTCLLFWVFWCDAAFILPMSIVKKKCCWADVTSLANCLEYGIRGDN